MPGLRPLLIALPILLAGAPAAAQGWDPEQEGGEVFVVEDLPVSLRHEFGFGVGVLPLDAFYTGYALSASYTYHPSDLLAWEVANGFLATDVDSDLQSRLLEDFEVQPTRFEKVVAGVFTHLVVKPLFGKRTLMGGPVYPVETSLFLGAGAVRYSQSVRAAGDFGVRFRAILSDWFSVRLSVRDMLPVDINGKVENELLVDLAGAFNFGGTD